MAKSIGFAEAKLFASQFGEANAVNNASRLLRKKVHKEY